MNLLFFLRALTQCWEVEQFSPTIFFFDNFPRATSNRPQLEVQPNHRSLLFQGEIQPRRSKRAGVPLELGGPPSAPWWTQPVSATLR